MFSSLYANIVLDNDINLPITQAELFIDKDANHTIETIVTQNFTHIALPQSLGYQDEHPIWIRLTVTNPHQYPVNIGFVHQHANEMLNVNLHLIKSSGEMVHTTINANHLAPINSHFFDLNLKPKESATLYVRQVTISYMLLDFALQSKATYDDALTQQLFIYGLIFGALIALIIYHLFIYITMRLRLYLYYIFFITSVTLFFMYASHILHTILDNYYTRPFNLNYFLLISILFLILFAQTILKTKEYAPFIHRAFQLLFSSTLLFIIISLIFGIKTMLGVVALFILISTVLIFLLALIVSVQGRREATIFVWALSANILAIVITVALYYGLLPLNSATLWIQYIGPIVEMIILSALISSSLKALRNSAIKHERELQNEIANRNTILEKQVQQTLQTIRQKDSAMLQQSRLVHIADTISMIAYQWCEPLTKIVQSTYTSHPSTKENRSKIFSTISLEAKRLSSTITHFKEFFTPNNDITHFKLADAVKSALKIIQPTLDSEDITLQLSSDTQEKIFQNQHEVMHIILKVVQNAYEAIVHDHVTKGLITVHIYQKNSHFIIDISDNGIGVDPKIESSLFEPYFTTKTADNRSGMGLYTIKTILAHDLQGTINYLRGDQNQTHFIITLPSLSE